MNKLLNVKEFQSVQSAVDAAGEFDTVVVPAGTYRCPGSVRLKSNLTLRLESGATLVAPREIDAYATGEQLHRPSAIERYFIGGFGLENLTIEGTGVFECSGDAFWRDYDGRPSPDGAVKLPVYQPLPLRPTAMMFVNCRNLRFRDFTIRNSASYTVWAIGCVGARLENLTVRNHRRGPNTDGLDIDCSRDVWITGCDIDAGDDCVALKSDIAMLGRDQACEGIHIAHCTLSSSCCAVRLGYEGDGTIRDVLVSDTVIRDSTKGFDLISTVTAKARFGIVSGARIENVVFRGAVMRNVRHAMAIWSGCDLDEDVPRYRGYIRNIRFSDLEIEALDSSFFGGIAVSQLAFSDIRMRVRRDMSTYQGATPAVMPTVWGRGYLPQAMTFYHVDDPVMSNVLVALEDFNC